MSTADMPRTPYKRFWANVLGSFYGFPLELEHLHTHGPTVMLELTKGAGDFW
jgi:hypothetical protein